MQHVQFTWLDPRKKKRATAPESFAARIQSALPGKVSFLDQIYYLCGDRTAPAWQ